MAIIINVFHQSRKSLCHDFKSLKFSNIGVPNPTACTPRPNVFETRPSIKDDHRVKCSNPGWAQGNQQTRKPKPLSASWGTGHQHNSVRHSGPETISPITCPVSIWGVKGKNGDGQEISVSVMKKAYCCAPATLVTGPLTQLISSHVHHQCECKNGLAGCQLTSPLTHRKAQLAYQHSTDKYYAGRSIFLFHGLFQSGKPKTT